jgi:hypothetical protein
MDSGRGRSLLDKQNTDRQVIADYVRHGYDYRDEIHGLGSTFREIKGLLNNQEPFYIYWSEIIWKIACQFFFAMLSLIRKSMYLI